MAILFPPPDEAPSPPAQRRACTVVLRCRFAARHTAWAEGPLGVVSRACCDAHVERARAIGWIVGQPPEACEWPYCDRSMTRLVERPGDDGPERIGVCDRHVVHAEAKDWAVVV